MSHEPEGSLNAHPSKEAIGCSRIGSGEAKIIGLHDGTTTTRPTIRSSLISTA